MSRHLFGMPMVLPMAPLPSLGLSDQTGKKKHVSVLWSHWYQLCCHVMPNASSMTPFCSPSKHSQKKVQQIFVKVSRFVFIHIYSPISSFWLASFKALIGKLPHNIQNTQEFTEQDYYQRNMSVSSPMMLQQLFTSVNLAFNIIQNTQEQARGYKKGPNLQNSTSQNS